MRIDERPVPAEVAPVPVEAGGEPGPAQRLAERAPTRDTGLRAIGGQRHSLLEALARSAPGDAPEPALFAGTRPVEILEDVLERILPSLPLDGDTRTLAMALIRDEIETRQALDRQRTEATPA